MFPTLFGVILTWAYKMKQLANYTFKALRGPIAAVKKLRQERQLQLHSIFQDSMGYTARLFCLKYQQVSINNFKWVNKIDGSVSRMLLESLLT